MSASRERLERGADETRSQLRETLEERRYRTTSGQAVDRLLQQARDLRVGEALTYLRRPIALGLIGLGVGWLMLPTRKRSDNAGQGLTGASGSDEDAAEMRGGLTSRISEIDNPIAGAASSAAERLMTFGRERPLFLAGAGLAFGAVIEALLPRPGQENETRGQNGTSNEHADATATGDAVEGMKDVAEKTVAEIAEEVGIVPDQDELSKLEADRERRD